MCREMSQYMPVRATISEPVASPEGSATHGGRSAMRPARSAARSSRRVRPARWPRPSAKRAVVATSAPAVAPMISLVAAPPAGLLAARRLMKFVMLLCITE
jgi:hypothetical protein